MNTTKSCLYTVGFHGQKLKEIKELTNIPKGTMPFCYLGIPIVAKKLKVSCFDCFLNKIFAYISTWTTLHFYMLEL